MGNVAENSRCFVVKCAKPGVVLIHGTAYCAKHALESEQRPKERVRERELADIDA